MNALKGIKEDGLDNSRADFEPVTCFATNKE